MSDRRSICGGYLAALLILPAASPALGQQCDLSGKEMMYRLRMCNEFACPNQIPTKITFIGSTVLAHAASATSTNLLNPAEGYILERGNLTDVSADDKRQSGYKELVSVGYKYIQHKMIAYFSGPIFVLKDYDEKITPDGKDVVESSTTQVSIESCTSCSVVSCDLSIRVGVAAPILPRYGDDQECDVHTK